jgi:GTPase SAR1 family protein
MSSLALKLIKNNKLTKAKYLDLGNCGLKTIPKAIGELTWLEALNLADKWIEWLDTTWSFANSQNTGESNSELSNISALAPLINLRKLNISNTKVSNISVLAALTNLEELEIYTTKITNIKPLSGLTKLTSLKLSETAIEDIPEIENLIELQHLYLTNTNISNISFASKLINLKTIDIGNTKVTNLRPLEAMILRGSQVGANVTTFQKGMIYINNCPLETPPIEIAQRGNDAILNYLKETESGTVNQLYEAKLIILGDGGAGKTSLLRRLFKPELGLPTEVESTNGIDIHIHKFKLDNGHTFRLNVWDFGGQEIYHSTHHFFLTPKSLYLLVDDTRKDQKRVSDPGFRDWLETIEWFGRNSPILLFQNERGGRKTEIDYDGICTHYKNIKNRYHGNLAHKNSANKIKAAIEFFASHLPDIGSKLPDAWLQVRLYIERIAATKQIIWLKDYFEIYARHAPFDQDDALHLSQYLHNLGVLLHFQNDDLLRRIIILRNSWATDAVYKLLDDEATKRKYGRFTVVDCERLWDDDRYINNRPEVLSLLEYFELCYVLPNSPIKTWLAPQLLPPSKSSFLKEWASADDLVLRYTYNILPNGIISRLMVRMHRFVRNPNLASRTCVLFERNESGVLVELANNGREIELRANGKARKELLNLISTELEAINDLFPGLTDKTEKLIPCCCKKCKQSIQPHFFAESKLVQRETHGKLKIECDASLEEMDIATLRDGLHVATPSLWAKPQIITIFLASTYELREDRDAFDLYFRQQNDHFQDQGIYLKVVHCENFLGAVSNTRKQDDYNEEVRKSDIFITLCATKTDQYTEEEFTVAYENFLKTGRPFIYPFFKDTIISASNKNKDNLESLWAFQEKLQKIGHFCPNYNGIEDLKLRFQEQLRMLLNTGKLGKTT